MRTTLGSLSAAALVFALMAVTSPALACNGNGNCENAPGQVKSEHAPGHVRGLLDLLLALGSCTLR
jgi:hypothetical protein